MVAQGWLVYQLTSSAFMLGAVGFAQSLPILLFSLFGGVLADRFERRRLMVWTQTGMMVLAFVLAFLTLRGLITIWHILAIAFLNGTVNAFNTPVRQSIVSDLVRREDLQNAIAINSTQFQLSRSLGPALAGATLAHVGPGWCFIINAMSFVAGRCSPWTCRPCRRAAARRRSPRSRSRSSTCAASRPSSRCC